LASVLQVVLELEGGVEVILDRALVAAGDEDDLGQPGGHRLLHHVLDGGLVDEGEHLLGLGLGRGEEASAEPGGREHGPFHVGHCPVRCRRYTTRWGNDIPSRAKASLMRRRSSVSAAKRRAGSTLTMRRRPRSPPSLKLTMPWTSGASRASPLSRAHSAPTDSRTARARRTSVSWATATSTTARAQPLL